MNMFTEHDLVIRKKSRNITDKPFNVGITLCNDNKLRIGNPVGKSEFRLFFYILSDKKIKESGKFHWFYNTETDMVFKSTIQHPNCKEIISTNDTDLVLPQTQKSFIDILIEEYNNDNVIKRVLVEYEPDRPENSMHYAMGSFDWQLKVDDNIINVKIN